MHEELGISPTIGRLLVVGWAPAEGEGDKLLFIFDGGSLRDGLMDRIVLQASEIEQYAYVPAADLPGVTIPRLVRRLLAALDADRRGIRRQAAWDTC